MTSKTRREWEERARREWEEKTRMPDQQNTSPEDEKEFLCLRYLIDDGVMSDDVRYILRRMCELAKIDIDLV